MNDIVERLRRHMDTLWPFAKLVSNMRDPENDNNFGKVVVDCREAAAEIERLRAERDMTVDGFKSIVATQAEEIERLRDQVTRLSTLVDTECSLHDAEIERLCRENEALGAAMSSDGAAACGQLAVAEAEIERLREENEELKHPHCDADHATEIERLREELDKLRGLLQQGINVQSLFEFQVWQQRVRETLEGRDA